MSKDIAVCYVFASSSDPDRTYQALLCVDGSTSCECPGWTRRAIRSCRHTRSIESGCAERECVRRVDYNKSVVARLAAKAAASEPMARREAQKQAERQQRSRFFDLEEATA